MNVALNLRVPLAMELVNYNFLLLWIMDKRYFISRAGPGFDTCSGHFPGGFHNCKINSWNFDLTLICPRYDWAFAVILIIIHPSPGGHVLVPQQPR